MGCRAWRIRYDNIKPAVVRVLRGRNRQETERFVGLRSHYGFDSFFCIPGKDGAHEKDGVEGEVGRFRRRNLLPVPRVESMEELNELVAAGDARDDRRRIFGRPLTVGQHFEIEAPALRPLPALRFDPTLLLKPRVDGKSRVCVRQCFYSVPVRFAGGRIDVRLGAERVEALDSKTVVADHVRAVGKGTEVLILDHYLEVFRIKPGAFPGATALARARASGAFTATHDEFWTLARNRLGDAAGTRALIEVLLLHRSVPRDSLLAGIRAALAVGSVDPEVVAIEARKVAERAVAPLVPIGALSRYDRPKPTLNGYDTLLEASS